MYVCTNPKAEFKKKSVLPCLNVSSLCSQHSDGPDFLITVFQSTSYEFVFVERVSNPMVSDHRSYLVVFPLVLNRRVKKIKWAYLHSRLWEVNSIGNTFPKVAEPVNLQIVIRRSFLHIISGNWGENNVTRNDWKFPEIVYVASSNTADQDRLHVHGDVNKWLLVQLSELLDLRFRILIRR